MNILKRHQPINLRLRRSIQIETRENKINLGIGVYKDAQGTTPIMRAVKEAEKRLFDKEKRKII